MLLMIWTWLEYSCTLTRPILHLYLNGDIQNSEKTPTDYQWLAFLHTHGGSNHPKIERSENRFLATRSRSRISDEEEREILRSCVSD